MAATPELTAAVERFGALIDSGVFRTPVPEPAPIYRHGTQLGWLFAQAHEHEMPAPGSAVIHNEDWDHVASIHLDFDSLADLTAWAMWADASIGDALGIDDAFLGYGFDAAINEVRLVCRYWTRDREVSA